jgi:hypothetical protein
MSKPLKASREYSRLLGFESEEFKSVFIDKLDDVASNYFFLVFFGCVYSDYA